MTLQHFDPRRATQNRRKQRRMVDVWIPRKRRIQRQKARHRLARGARHLHIPHRRTVVQRVNREEARHLLAILVDVFEQEAVGPDGQPGVDALGAQRAIIRVELAQRLLDALQAVLGHVGHG